MGNISRIVGVVGFALIGHAALAQETPVVSGGPGEGAPKSGVGMSVQAGGGVTNFSRQEARNAASTGGFWEARLVYGTRSIFGGELAYVGSAQGMNAAGVASGAALLGNGGEALLRLNAPIVNRGALFEPFVFGGMGWTHYSLINEGVNTSNVANADNVGTIPFGGGMAIAYHGFIADARFTYRATYDNGLVALGAGDHANLQNWSLGLQAGFEF
jgi:hypothetical protein